MIKLIHISTLICICLISKGYGQIQKGLDIDGEASNDMFSSLSMPDPNTIGIGARDNDGNGSNSGHVRIYRWNGSTWIQKGSDINGEAAGDNSGESISTPDSNTVAISAPANSGGALNSGHVRVYAWNGAAWAQKGFLKRAMLWSFSEIHYKGY